MQRVAREGKRIRTTHLEVRAAASPLARPAGAQMRVGLVVPRFKQSAVARNRLKRRLRELARLRLLPSDISVDIVVRIRAEAYAASFDMLAEDVGRVLKQLARWRDTAAGLAPPGAAPQGPHRSAPGAE